MAATGFCDAETNTTESGTTFVWPVTEGGESATFNCPLSPEVVVTRMCGDGGVWQSFNEGGCGVVLSQLNSLNDSFNNVRLYE